jgi:hypothetical protein
LNCLQGVMIFFSFAYQGKTKKLVKEKWVNFERFCVTRTNFF